jgi:hypothetical protein
MYEKKNVINKQVNTAVNPVYISVGDLLSCPVIFHDIPQFL